MLPSGVGDPVHHTSYKIVYVTNWESDDIGALRLERNGSLQGPPRVFPVVDGALNPLVAALGPDGKHLYVSDWGSGDISTYEIGRRGTLIPRVKVKPAGPPLTNPSGLAISGDGKHLFLAAFNGGGHGTISSFTIDRSGRPSPLVTVDAHGDGSAGIALSPDGRTLYVANMTSGDVSVFAVGRDGSLRWMRSAASGAGAFFPAVTPNGRWLVVANATSSDLSVFRVLSRRRLRPTAGPTPAEGDGPRGVVISPDGRHVYVAHYNGGTGPGSVAAFLLERDGRLIPAGAAVPTGGNGAEAMVLDPSTRRLLVANFNTGGLGSISSLALHRDGGVSLAGEPVSTGGEEPDFGGLTILKGGERRV
jgi:6-phosphogluconolactonase (cycloisomerase 2 family)